jgi:UDP-3-O-[3-hydroxymyristoyl] N-acetylglucosamine deacetylase
MAVMPELDRTRELLFSYEGKGLTSRALVKVDVFEQATGSGITFRLNDPKPEGGGKSFVDVPANSDFVVNTMRNVVLGIGSARLCIVEHFLCAATLWGANDLLVAVDGLEMPLGDGSALMWMELFQKSKMPRREIKAEIELTETIAVRRGDRQLMVIPSDEFSITYLMDWNHPKIGKRWKTWTAKEPFETIALARTFGSLKEHQMLGLENDVVSLTEDGFTMPLHSEDEPVCHKLLDLLGDLALVGVNPLSIKGQFISIKGGHEMDVDLAKRIRQLVIKK